MFEEFEFNAKPMSVWLDDAVEVLDSEGLPFSAKAVKQIRAYTAKLEAGYREAIEDIDSWGAYASQYFTDKHDLDGCIEAHRTILNTYDV
jgi:hypothetical protein